MDSCPYQDPIDRTLHSDRTVDPLAALFSTGLDLEMPHFRYWNPASLEYLERFDALFEQGERSKLQPVLPAQSPPHAPKQLCGDVTIRAHLSIGLLPTVLVYN